MGHFCFDRCGLEQVGKCFMEPNASGSGDLRTPLAQKKAPTSASERTARRGYFKFYALNVKEVRTYLRLSTS